VNFAFGGSSTDYLSPVPGGLVLPGLKGQVELFRAALSLRQAPSGALYAIFAGANDYLLAAPETPGDPAVVVDNISDAVRSLYYMGAREILVVNLPDLGAIPLVAGTPAGEGLSRLTDAHNSLLEQSGLALSTELSGIKLIVFDAHTLFQQLLETLDSTTPAVDTLFPPPAPGEVPMSRCLFVDPHTCQDVATFNVSRQFLFWDAEHPTTTVHSILAQNLYSALAR
jgi:phospholipase/lecithinase/hemolysin